MTKPCTVDNVSSTSDYDSDSNFDSDPGSSLTSYFVDPLLFKPDYSPDDE